MAYLRCRVPLVRVNDAPSTLRTIMRGHETVLEEQSQPTLVEHEEIARKGSRNTFGGVSQYIIVKVYR